jgi:hypothetical protein
LIKIEIIDIPYFASGRCCVYVDVYVYTHIHTHIYVFLFIYFYAFLLLCWVGVHWHLQKFLQYIEIYHTWIHPLHHSPLSPSPPHSWNSFKRNHFSFTYMCTQYLHCSLPPMPFSPLPTPSHWYQPPQLGPVNLWSLINNFCVRIMETFQVKEVESSLLIDGSNTLWLSTVFYEVSNSERICISLNTTIYVCIHVHIKGYSVNACKACIQHESKTRVKIIDFRNF